MNRPTGVIFDKENNSLIVADIGNRRVFRWSLKKAQREILIENFGSYSLAKDQYGFLYASYSKNDEVRKWKIGEETDKEGILVAGGNAQGDNLNQLYNPVGLIVDPLGRQIYIADYGNDRIMRWCDGDKEGKIVVGGNEKGDAPNQLSCPIGLSLDFEGNLYVVDHENHRIQRFYVIS